MCAMFVARAIQSHGVTTNTERTSCSVQPCVYSRNSSCSSERHSGMTSSTGKAEATATTAVRHFSGSMFSAMDTPTFVFSPKQLAIRN